MTDDITELLSPSKVTAGIYIVATPIGNIKDITLRALETLKSVDIIACEDTRMTQKLLSYYNIHTKLMQYHDHSSEETRQYILNLAGQGKSIALVSDAGTPLISDPGYKLIRTAQEQGIAITTLPGASSVPAAITLAGLPSNRFLFAGFLPNKQQARQNALLPLKPIDTTLIFFESARRLPEMLADMLEIFGNREAAVVREISKLYEEAKRDSLENLVAYYQEYGAPKGEVVVLVAPPEDEITTEDDLDSALKKALETMSVKDAAQYVAKQTGLPKKQVYARALSCRNPGKH